MADNEVITNAAQDRAAAPAALDDKAAMIARNKAALDKRRATAAALKEAENSKTLPAGWRRVESNSQPGTFVYENEHTEERQAWFPTEVAGVQGGAGAEAVMSDADRLKAKNKAALEKRKAAAAAAKAELASKEPPAGWKKCESNSRPGEFVYENSVTGDRQAWFPDKPCISEEDIAKQQLKDKNKAALAAMKAARASKDEGKTLPDGWTKVESRSRPGEFVYENTKTGERQAWFPAEEAVDTSLPEGWRKVESRTYPGEFVYENKHTLERQAWEPTTAAPMTEGAAAAPPPAQAAPKAAVIATAVSEYDYTAQNMDEEIDLLEGDKINIHYKADNGWWVGENTRTARVGIFPGTYVKLD